LHGPKVLGDYRCPRPGVGRGNGRSVKSLGPMDRIFLAIICAGIITLVVALGLGSQGTNSDGITTGLHQRNLPR
jgi:hypothetical protein